MAYGRKVPTGVLSESWPPWTPAGGLNQRGGRIDIEERAGRSKIEEALEESFPASDAPCHTPYGYIDIPPPFRK